MSVLEKLKALGFTRAGNEYTRSDGVRMTVTEKQAHIKGGPVGPEVLEVFSELVEKVQHE